MGSGAFGEAIRTTARLACLQPAERESPLGNPPPRNAACLSLSLSLALSLPLHPDGPTE